MATIKRNEIGRLSVRFKKSFCRAVSGFWCDGGSAKMSKQKGSKERCPPSTKLSMETTPLHPLLLPLRTFLLLLLKLQLPFLLSLLPGSLTSELFLLHNQKSWICRCMHVHVHMSVQGEGKHHFPEGKQSGLAGNPVPGGAHLPAAGDWPYIPRLLPYPHIGLGHVTSGAALRGARTPRPISGTVWGGGGGMKQQILSYRFSPRDTGYTVTARTVQSKPVLNIALSPSNWTIKCCLGACVAGGGGGH